MQDAKASFLDFGGLSKNRSVLTHGKPGLVISKRFEKISTIGAVPVTGDLRDISLSN
jgi:hypothetical protein